MKRGPPACWLLGQLPLLTSAINKRAEVLCLPQALGAGVSMLAHSRSLPPLPKHVNLEPEQRVQPPPSLQQQAEEVRKTSFVRLTQCTCHQQTCFYAKRITLGVPELITPGAW